MLTVPDQPPSPPKPPLQHETSKKIVGFNGDNFDINIVPPVNNDRSEPTLEPDALRECTEKSILEPADENGNAIIGPRTLGI